MYVQKSIVVFLIIGCCFASFAKSGSNYPVSSIPDSLKENAHAVIRDYKTVFEIKSKSRAVKEVRKVITILDRQGEDFANFRKQYDDFKNLKGVRGEVYDAEGNEIKKIRRWDIKDIDKYSSMSLYEDTQVKYYENSIAEFPVTVVYEYKIKYNGLLNFPVWKPQNSSGLAIENAFFKVIAPQEVNFRHKTFNEKLFAKQKLAAGKNSITYSWELKNCKAFKTEKYSPRTYRAYTPVVYTAAEKFSIEGYEGNMESWQSFGQWTYRLNMGRKALPQSTQNYLLNLVDENDDPFTKTKKVYQYMQSKTRYVSIQLGIGGWQPFEAAVVDEKNYGDCKALTNYTQAMLDVVGVKSHYTLVKAGSSVPEVIESFPSQQFNHSILCVPLEKDTIWLECTDNRNPFGYLGNFTSDRKVLMITSKGGKLVKTPDYPLPENKSITKGTIKVKKDGHGLLNMQKRTIGLAYEKWRYFLYQQPEEQQKWLYKNLSYNSFSINNYNIDFEPNVIPELNLKFELSLNNLASVTGNRMFIPISPGSGFQERLTASSNRVQPVVINKSVNKIDTLYYEISDNWNTEYIPDNINIQSKYGKYHLKITKKGNQIVIARRFLLKKGEYGKDTYQSLVKFRDKVNTTEKENLVLVK